MTHTAVPANRSRRVDLSRFSLVPAIVALLIAAVGATSAQPLPTFVNEPANGLTVAGSGSSASLLWFSSCGTELTPAVPAVRALQTSISVAPPVPLGNVQTLYAPGVCDGAQPVGERLVVHGSYVYWAAANGTIVRRLTTAAPSSPAARSWPMHRRPPLIGGGVAPGVAVDDWAISWTEVEPAPEWGSSVYEVQASVPGSGDFDRPRGRAYHTINQLDHLVAGPYGLRFAIDRGVGGAANLVALLPTATGAYESRRLSVTDYVSALAVDRGAVYWAESTGTAYSIYIRTISQILQQGRVIFGNALALATVSGLPNNTEVTGLTVDPTPGSSRTRDLWWSVQEVGASAKDAAIVHLTRATGALSPLVYQLEASAVASIVTDGHYVFWAGSNAIYRVLAGGVAPHAPDQALAVTDVSPDRAYQDGVSTDDYYFGADPGGRIGFLVIDPTDDNVLLAASPAAGPWKSTDGGRSWHQSATGMTSGLMWNDATIAIDASDHRRALAITGDEGIAASGRTSFRVWVSFNTGDSWRAVDTSQLPVTCPGTSNLMTAKGVAFAGGRGYVSTSCGLYSSQDLLSWALVTAAGAPPANAFIVGSGDALYACSGSTVRRGTAGGTSWISRNVPRGSCYGAIPLAPIPDGTATPQVVVVLHSNGDATGQATASQLDVVTGTVTDLGFPSIPVDADGNRTYSGEAGVWVARARSGGTWVFGANGNHYFMLTRSEGWFLVRGVHMDTHSMAFPSTFDPPNGPCDAYVASDGSVAFNDNTIGYVVETMPAVGPWLRAQHGLHAYKSQMVNGVHRTWCPEVNGNVEESCPVLYVTSGDNGEWIRDEWGNPDWTPLHDCCGDAGGVVLDPTRPSPLVITRNGVIQVYYPNMLWATDRARPYITSSETGSNNPPPNFADRGDPPSPNTYSMVMTVDPATDTNFEEVALRGIPAVPNGTAGADQVAHRTNNGGWTNLGPALPFESVKQVATSGGPAHLVVWIRTASGRILRSPVASNGTIASWPQVSPAGMNAQIMFANPYDPDELWVQDGNTQMIQWSRSDGHGGLTWTQATELTAFAKGYDSRFGTERWIFGRWQIFDTPFASLNHMWFGSGTTAAIHVATFGAGGVAVSRDHGATWIPLTDSLPFDQWLAHPWSTWYDAGAAGVGTQSDLYIALAGRGVMRVRARFDSLVDMVFQYCPSGGCVAPLSANADSQRPRSLSGGSSVVVIDETTERKVVLDLDIDGVYRGHELIDATGIGTVYYHFVVDGVADKTLAHTVTEYERANGHVGSGLLPKTADPNTPGVGPLSYDPAAVFTEACDQAPTTVHFGVSVTSQNALTGVQLQLQKVYFDIMGDQHSGETFTLPMSSWQKADWYEADVVPAKLGMSVSLDDQAWLSAQVEALVKGGVAYGSPALIRLQACGPEGGAVPSAPPSVSASGRDSAAFVSWKPPASDGGQPVTGYLVTPHAAKGDLSPQMFGADNDSGNVSGLVNGETYTFTVAAFNVLGVGPESEPSNPVTPEPPAPARRPRRHLVSVGSYVPPPG